MKNFAAGRSCFSYQPLFVAGFILLLLFSVRTTVTAAPFCNNPDQIGIFFTQDYISGGSHGGQTYDSYNGINIGVAIPTGYGSAGFRIVPNQDTDYMFYEVFTNWSFRGNLLMEFTFSRLDDDAKIIRFGAYRELPITNIQGFKAHLGPGLSTLINPSSDWFGEDWVSFSLYLQAKAHYDITENLFVYGTGLYDFNFNSSSYELGLGFTY